MILSRDDRGAIHHSDNGDRIWACSDAPLVIGSFSHAQASRLTAIRSKDLGSGSTVEGFTYTYDNMVNRKTQGQEANGTSLSFAYDKEYALNATTYEGGSKAYYQYDANDNRQWRNATGGKREYLYSVDSSLDRMKVYNSGGQLIETVTFLYDGNGNNVQKARATTTTYAYDLENRLTQVAVGGSTQATYAYFSDGSKIRRTASGTTTYYLYDFRDFNGYNDILEEYDAAGNRIARYVHGPGADEPLAMDRGGSWYYYHVDGLGSVTMLTRADKTVANSYAYDDFGAFRSKSEAVQNPYGFTGRETDVLGLVYYRSRYYDTEIGRFLERDPAGMVDGANLYSYSKNNPVSSTDPSGKWLVNLWIPCALTWTWGALVVRWAYFDTDVFFNCLLLGAFNSFVRDVVNYLTLFYYTWWCVYFLVTICWGLVVTAILTGVGWIPAVTCIMASCGILVTWFVGCTFRALSCR